MERIKFGKCFNQPVCDVAWPETLQEMRFGDDFNQQVDGDFTLPPALRALTFGFWFSQPLQAVRFPEQLRELDLGFFYSEPLDGVEIPANLEIMKVGFGQQVDLSDVRLFGWEAHIFGYL